MNVREAARIGAALGVASAVLACASPKDSKAPPAPPAGPLTVGDLLPFQDRTTLSFTARDDLGGTSFFVMEIERPKEERGEIWIAGRAQRFRISPDRVERIEGGVLLEAPLEVGHTFHGSFGVTEITKVGERVSVPAGTFDGCLVTLEQAASPAKRVETTYCPKIGIVRVVVDGASDTDVTHVQSELTAYGPWLDIHKLDPHPNAPAEGGP